MPFYTLLILLSLIIIVPIFFVIKEKSKQNISDSTSRHKQFLQSAPIKNDAKVLVKPTVNIPSTLEIIEFSAQHPFVKLLNHAYVPLTFKKILDEIGQQYERTHHKQLTESQLFTLNKLIETRIPELINDYLSLDPDYATTVIVDNEKKATSYDVVVSQLHTILNFTQKLNAQSQSGVVDKLLANRNYLQEVYQDSGMDDNALKINQNRHLGV